jgi:hypothetical protein
VSVWVDVSTVVTAAAAVTALAAGYVQFVLKRSVLPYAEFDVDFTPLYKTGSWLFGEVDLIIKNQGTNMMVVTKVRCRVRVAFRNRSGCPVRKRLDRALVSFSSVFCPGGKPSGFSLPGAEYGHFYAFVEHTFLATDQHTFLATVSWVA